MCFFSLFHALNERHPHPDTKFHLPIRWDNKDFLYTLTELLDSYFEKVKHEGYYVKMAVAWAVSICYIKYPKETVEDLKKNTLDDFTHNKAIQKIRESYRVSEEEKENLLCLKR